MNAVVFHRHGGADTLVYEEAPLPTVGPGDVLVRVKACALNHLDIWIREGIPAFTVPLPHTAVTAWHMLFGLARLRPAEDVLVLGAGSGVGTMAVQMARAAGARVITTVGTDEKIEKAKALGADAMINHAREDITERVKAFTAGRGVDVVIEHVGPATWDSYKK